MAKHPMMKPTAWVLWTGAAGVPTLHRTAAVFWLAGGVMLSVWLGGLLYEALVWGVDPLILMLGLVVAAGWCLLAWSSWASWRADQVQLTLLWTGQTRQADKPSRQSGGFRVTQWDAPVRVEVLLDLQRWMLLRLTTVAGAPRRQAWLWLVETPAKPMHQLRSLVHLSAREVLGGPSAKAPYDEGARPSSNNAMASWLAKLFKSGSKLRPASPMPLMPNSAHGITSCLESAFPSTLVMREEDGVDPSQSSRLGERN